MKTQKISKGTVIIQYIYIYTVRSRYIAVIFLCTTHERVMGCRSWVQTWPKFYHCNRCAVDTIVSYIIAIYRASIVTSNTEINNHISSNSRNSHSPNCNLCEWISNFILHVIKGVIIYLRGIKNPCLLWAPCMTCVCINLRCLPPVTFSLFLFKSPCVSRTYIGPVFVGFILPSLCLICIHCALRSESVWRRNMANTHHKVVYVFETTHEIAYLCFYSCCCRHWTDILWFTMLYQCRGYFLWYKKTNILDHCSDLQFECGW